MIRRSTTYSYSNPIAWSSRTFSWTIFFGVFISLTKTIMVNKLLSSYIETIEASKITLWWSCTEKIRMLTFIYFIKQNCLFLEKKTRFVLIMFIIFSYILIYSNSTFSQQNKTLKNIGYQDKYSYYSIAQERVCMKMHIYTTCLKPLTFPKY